MLDITNELNKKIAKNENQRSSPLSYQEEEAGSEQQGSLVDVGGVGLRHLTHSGDLEGVVGRGRHVVEDADASLAVHQGKGHGGQQRDDPHPQDTRPAGLLKDVLLTTDEDSFKEPHQHHGYSFRIVHHCQHKRSRNSCS